MKKVGEFLHNFRLRLVVVRLLRHAGKLKSRTNTKRLKQIILKE